MEEKNIFINDCSRKQNDFVITIELRLFYVKLS